MNEKEKMEEKEKVRFEKYERLLGSHRIEGVKVEGGWWALRQMQYVNGGYTQSGCNWYSKVEIQKLLEEESKLVDSGEARTEEVDGCELLITKDEEMEYMV